MGWVSTPAWAASWARGRLCAGAAGVWVASVAGSAAASEAPLVAAEVAGLRPVEERAALEPGVIVLEGATVLTAAGHRHEPGYVVIVDGRIDAVGGGAAPKLTGARALDVRGMFVTPGLIDTHSHLGVYPSPGAGAHADGNEMTSPTTAGVWAEHSFWPQDPGLERAIAGGVTTLQVLPGSANLIGGRGVTLEVVPRRGSRAMRFPGAPETVKMACGENPKRVYGQRTTAPQTRMGNLRGQRQAFLDAVSYRQKWDEHVQELERFAERAADEKQARKRSKSGEPPQPPDRNLDLETLAGVLRGDILPQVHCYRADDMLSVLQLADEFGFSVRSFHHALEAYKIRDILAEREVAASTWADWWGFKLEAYDGIQQNAALLAEAGGRPVIHSDSAIGIQRLNQEASKAWHAGLAAGIELDADEALRWVTANPAWALGIDDQTGSLEVGKRADVVVWDRDPFSVYASARWVFVEGALRYDAERTDPPWSDFERGQGVP